MEPNDRLTAATAACQRFGPVLGVDLEVVSVRVEGDADRCTALVMLREHDGDGVRYRGGSAAAGSERAAITAAVVDAVTGGERVVVAAARRWAARPGVVAVTCRTPDGLTRLVGSGPASEEQERLVSVDLTPGVVEAETALALHVVVVVEPDVVAVAGAPGGDAVTTLRRWCDELVEALG